MPHTPGSRGYLITNPPEGNDGPVTIAALVRRPSGYLPMVLSVAAVALVLGRLAMFGMARQADEGTAAHLWQLLMVIQVPLIAVFGLTWLPRVPKAAGIVFAFQVLAFLAALSPVFLLKL